MPRLKNNTHESIVQQYIKGKNKRKAYMSEHPVLTEFTQKTLPYQFFNRQDVQNRVNELLNAKEEAKLENILNLAVDSLVATKQVVGQRNSILELKDNETRQRAIDRMLKLHRVEGFNPPEKEQTTQNNLTINMSNEDIDKLGSILGQIKAMRESAKEENEIQSGEVL
jgi:hypothetical protein